MTRLFNDPADFADEMVEGFVAANHRHVRAVPGGVVRSRPAPEGAVAVVIGGGSGHYPAFAGLVGPGLAHGAAMGNLFASPSRQQVHTVASAAARGGGVLLTYGNYAGDVLNFTAAQDQLRAEGVDCRTVLVTDDVSSAPPMDRHERRGVAGDLVVFKVAGAAAEEGYSLDGVERVARLANERTRSFGVAFDGCTMPGADAPLFTVAPGRMAIGLGIHGEPGVGETDVPTADGLAELLLSTLLAELPDGVRTTGGQRVAVVLNGLGSVKYEELFVVYRSVARRLADAGLRVVEPEVGEFCTSLDMAGVSLTLCWLDDELDWLWQAPADSPAFRKRVVSSPAGVMADEPVPLPRAQRVGVPEASENSRAAAEQVARALEAAAAAIDGEAAELGRMDAVAGDGDHGAGMQRGLRAATAAARAALAEGAGAGTVLQRAGDAWGDRAGGTSGALWGLLLQTVGARLGDRREADTAAVGEAVAAAVEALRAKGGAEPGDKTMVDAAVPFSAALTAGAGERLGVAWSSAAARAFEAATATAELVPRLGRARTHGRRSVGTPDPGAYSFAVVVSAMATVFQEGGGE